MKQKIKYLILTLIIFLGVGLRFYKLGSIPRAAQVDEASFGYIAYSLVETGKDEHGQAWPLIFTAFGDDKLPLQAYLMMPAVKIFGLNNFSIRSISALSGSSLILITYLLAKEVTKKETASLMTAFVAALTPWSLFLSRFGYESNLALTIFAVSLLFLLKYIHQKRNKFLWPAAALMALTGYAYIAYRLVTALFLASTLGVLLIKKELKLRKAVTVFVFYLILISPFLLINGSSNTTRFEQLFGDNLKGITLEVNEQRNFCSTGFSKAVCYAASNKIFYLIRSLFNRFIQTFSPHYLMINGETDLNYMSVPKYGPYLVPAYLLFIYGLVVSIKKNLDSDKLILLVGTAFAPIASILVSYPHKVRMSALLVFLLIWTAIGLKHLMKLVSSKLWRIGVFILVILMSSYLGFAYYITLISVHFPKEDQAFVSYLPETFNQIDQLAEDKLVFIKPFFSDPILYYAYFNQIDPLHYQQNVVLGKKEESGFQHAVGLDNIKVADLSLKEAACLGFEQDKKSILITDQDHNLPTIKVIKSVNGVHDLVYFYDATAENDQDICN